MSGREANRRYFDELARAVDSRWTAAGRRDDRLTGIAVDTLVELPVPDTLDAVTVLDRLVRDDALPKQRKVTDQFGQPPTVLYLSSGLEVQALTWIEGTTSIHQHGFDGAFRVLQGSSLHVQYDFEPSEELADGHLVAGTLRMKSAEVLTAGDVRAIPAGPGFIHSLFHLERPSVTIVVRNDSSNLPFPQYDYRHPGLGIDIQAKDERLSMRLRALRAIESVAPDDGMRVALELVRAEDLWTAFRVTEFWFRNVSDDDRFGDLAGALAARDTTMSGLVEEMFGEQKRQARLLRRRGMLDRQPHRLLLAVLVNLPDPGSVAATMAALFPGREPAEVTLEIVEELASPQLRGLSGMHLSPEGLDAVRRALRGNQFEQALSLLGDQWHPPSLADLA
jgi:predicted metal-dependent enzyme (double-stranded beta helix superfamily)